MSIRLSKACKDLNVGMSTAIDFLAKKGHKLLVDPNLKLTDEEHLLLAKEFNKDMALKLESERISNERHLKEKAASVALDGYSQPKPAAKPETIITSVPEDVKPQIKAVGHIDLDAGRLPEIGGALGKSIRNFKKATDGKDEIEITPKGEDSDKKS